VLCGLWHVGKATKNRWTDDEESPECNLIGGFLTSDAFGRRWRTCSSRRAVRFVVELDSCAYWLLRDHLCVSSTAGRRSYGESAAGADLPTPSFPGRMWHRIQMRTAWNNPPRGKSVPGCLASDGTVAYRPRRVLSPNQVNVAVILWELVRAGKACLSVFVNPPSHGIERE